MLSNTWTKRFWEIIQGLLLLQPFCPELEAYMWQHLVLYSWGQVISCCKFWSSSHFVPKVSGSAGRMNHKISHVSDEVSCQAQVEEHVENIKQHLPWVLSMQVSIASGCECCDRPVHCSDISVPKTILFEIWVRCADPGLFWIGVSVCNQIVKASSTMYREKGHLKIGHNLYGEMPWWQDFKYV